MDIQRIDAHVPDGPLVAWELVAILEDNSPLFIGAIYESVVDFEAITFTVGGKQHTVSLN